MRILISLFVLFSLYSCWTKPTPHHGYDAEKVWGNKPIYASIYHAKQIAYIDSSLPVVAAGNICAVGDKIYQVEMGRGIHVIDNSIPSQAHRIGFISVGGSSQLTVKDGHLYVNSFDDLVVLDISIAHSVSELNRIPGAFPDGINNYYLVQPTEPGYYECPVYDSIVVGWKKDSVWNYCHKD